MGKGKGPQERIPHTSADRDEFQVTHILRPENEVTVRPAVNLYCTFGLRSLLLIIVMFHVVFGVCIYIQYKGCSKTMVSNTSGKHPQIFKEVALKKTLLS